MEVRDLPHGLQAFYQLRDPEPGPPLGIDYGRDYPDPDPVEPEPTR